MAELARELLTASVYGLTVGLFIDAGAMDSVADGLPHWWHSSRGLADPMRTWSIASDAAEGIAEATVAELELWVAEHALKRIFVHAGVVAVNGRALLLPGRSLAGKTTLTAALVRAGAAYGSDEYAPLLADGRVETYPRPLWVRPIEGGDRRRETAAELGGKTFDGAIPVGGVAVLHYDASPGWATSAATRGAALLGLVDNCVPARSRPQAMLEAMAAALADARAMTGTRGDADEAAHRLIEWMAA